VHDGLAALRDAGAVAEILALPSQLAGVARVLARLPGLAAIIDHAGMPDFAAPPTAEWREAIARLSRLPDTLCKITSFWNPGDPPDEDRRALAILGPVLEAFGPARIIAGANWPCTKLAGPYIQSWTLIDRLLAASGLGAAEQAAILYHNAARLCRTHAS
jgi:L-fuconolactonase